MKTSLAAIHRGLSRFSRRDERRRVDSGRRDNGTVPLADQQARRHPISRWYVRPAAGWLAAALAPTRVRPAHLTVCGLAAASAAAVLLAARPDASPVAAAMVLAAWFFDRADGLLARRQQTASAWGAWLDANVDELIDVGLHVAVAAAAATLTASTLPWALLVAFLAGKYLLVCSLALEEQNAPREEPSCDATGAVSGGWLRRAYHLPGNADVRVHLLVLALVTGWLTAELALVAAYYNVRWIARYVLVFRRWGGRR
jgi:phosphatidylglycerophosphate synthase